MIVVPEPAEKGPVPNALVSTSEILPPTYTPQSISATVSEVVQVSPPSPPEVKPTNYLSLCREKNSIKGTYAIDPSLCIPPSLLPPLAAGETEKDRKNLNLETNFGSIDAHIRIVGNETTEGAKERLRAKLFMRAEKGSILAKVYTPTSSRPSFHLSTSSKFGSTFIYLPRSFEGLVTITSIHGTVKFSDGLETHITPFSEVEETRRCFVGDFSRWSEGESGWNGDEVTVRAKFGKVRLQYEDEEKIPIKVVKAKGQGFFSRVFS